MQILSKVESETFIYQKHPLRRTLRNIIMHPKNKCLLLNMNRRRTKDFLLIHIHLWQRMWVRRVITGWQQHQQVPYHHPRGSVIKRGRLHCYLPGWLLFMGRRQPLDYPFQDQIMRALLDRHHLWLLYFFFFSYWGSSYNLP